MDYVVNTHVFLRFKRDERETNFGVRGAAAAFSVRVIRKSLSMWISNSVNLNGINRTFVEAVAIKSLEWSFFKRGQMTNRLCVFETMNASHLYFGESNYSMNSSIVH